MAKQVIILSTTAGVGGMTAVQYAMWLVPSAGQVVPNPNFVSAYAGASATEINSLQQGTTVEVVNLTQYPSSFTLTSIEADLLAKYSTAQSAYTSGVSSVQWYGTYYEGSLSSWTAQSLSLPPSNFVSGVWTNATATSTALLLTLAGASNVLLYIENSGTITAGTVGYQVSPDGASWFAIQGMASNGFLPSGGFNLTGNNACLMFNTAGYSFFRVILTIAIVGSGSSTLSIQGTSAPSIQLLTVGQSLASNLNATVVGAGTAGTPSGGVVSVQGVTSGAAIPVSGTFWQATQPVSLAALPALVAGSATIGSVDILGSAGVALDTAVGSTATNAVTVTNVPNKTAGGALSATVKSAQATAVNIKATAGSLYGFAIVSSTATAGFVQFFNTATTATSGCVWAIPIAASGTIIVPPSVLALLNFSAGIAINVATPLNGTTTQITWTGTIMYL